MTETDKDKITIWQRVRCWLFKLVSRHEWTKWEDLKVQQSECGDYRIVQQRRCKKTGKVQLRTTYSS